MTATPRIDAVADWIRGGRQGDIDWPPPDPYEGMTNDERLDAALRMIGGAPAELGSKPLAPTPPRRPRWRKKKQP